MEFGLKPCNFEPQYTEEELEEMEAAAEPDRNSGHSDDSAERTCRCTQCCFETAIVEEEKTCCRSTDNDLTVFSLDDYCCITHFFGSELF